LNPALVSTTSAPRRSRMMTPASRAAAHAVLSTVSSSAECAIMLKAQRLDRELVS